MGVNDWVYAVRTLHRNWRFTLAAVLTLALGIGSNTAIFSFIDTVYLRPLPYPQPDRLMTVQEIAPNAARMNASPAAYLSWRGNPSLFASVGAWNWDVVTITGGPWPERAHVQRVAGDYFQALGVQPILGRTFVPEEESGARCAVMLSASLWRNWLAGDAGVIARAVSVDGAPCHVAGVMPDGFLPPISAGNPVDVWMPLLIGNAQAANRDSHSLIVLARLAPGVTRQQAQSRLDAAASDTEAKGWGTRLTPLKEQIVGSPNKALFALAGAVGFLLLIACINVATLLTARAAGQRREIAIRAALGAGRARLMAHLLAQTILLAGLGGAGGLAATWMSLDAMVALAHGTLPRLGEAHIDWRVLAFTALVSLSTGFFFGLAPALGLSKASLREIIGVRGGPRILRDAQIAAEIALAFLLLTGAGLLLRSFQAIRAVDLGFRTEHILSANFALPPSHTPDPAQYARFLTDVLERVRALPGVLSATATTGVPMRGSAGGKFEVFGRPLRDGEPQDAAFRPADSEYLSTFGMTLDRGRTFTAADVDGAPRVALVNQTFARQIFAGGDPIGKQIRAIDKNGTLPWMTIAGVARDTRHAGPLNEAMPEIYVPYLQFRSTKFQPIALVVRTLGEPERLLPSLQRAVASVDKDQPLVSVSSMEQNLADFIAPQRFDTTLMAIFAAIGLTLAAVGIFGVMSFRVSQRTREIGIRAALGAGRADLLWMVLADGLRTMTAGLALGWIGAWGLTRYLASLLFTVKPGDPVTIASVSLVVIGTAMAACYLPARRASRLDPMVALREE